MAFKVTLNQFHCIFNDVSFRYLKGLRFGSFDPTTGDAIAWGGTDGATRGDIGSFITMYNSLNIEISNLEIDGNSPTMILGGGWGDVGRQLGHDAIDLVGNMNVLVSNIHAHHFGKDGMQVGTYANPYPVLNHTVQDCRFESNGRQGMSWIGGTGLRVLRSSFNHQGSGAPGLNSPPGAGFDVEQEMALNRDAYFEGNEFLNNAGCQFVADSGDSAGIYMKNNVLWGVNGGGWSWWVVKPDVVFTDGQIFGSTVHGYSTTNYSLSTRHFHTYFSDPLWYDGRWTVSDFLLNINNINMLHYERSTFITTWRKPMWSSGNGPEYPLLQHQILYSNIFVNISDAAGQWDYGYIIRGTRVKGDRLEWSFGKQHFYAAWGGNVDSGGTFGVTSPDNTTNQWQ